MSTDDISISVSSQKELTINEKTDGKITGRLMLAVFGAVLGSLQFGFNTGVINAPEGKIKDFMNGTHIKRTGEEFSEDALINLYSLLVAIFAVGGMIGGLMAGWWADFFGRKFGLILNTLPGIAAACLMFFSRHATSYEMVIAGRFLVGFNCGLYTGLTPLYLSEISTPNIRGALGTLHQFGVVIGILLSQVLGFPEVLGNGQYWHVLLGMCIVPCALQLLVMPFCPESPRYLLITKEQEDKALSSLRTLRGTSMVDADISEMKREQSNSRAEAKEYIKTNTLVKNRRTMGRFAISYKIECKVIGMLHLFKKKSLWMPLVISIIMHLSQQLSGINAIFYYSATLFKSAGVSETTAAHATSGIGAIMVVMTLITIPLMDIIGRRTLHLTGLAGMFVFSILITLSLVFQDQAKWVKIATIVVSLCFVVFFAIGPGSIPWMIVAELFSQGPRPAAMSISVLINWIFNFVVGYLYPFLQKAIGHYSFIPFTGCLALSWIFLFKYLPETKNKTIEEISSQWERKPKEGFVAKEDTGLVHFKTSL
ncbi:solute carrier family 2, facilitated glucose transporter member 1-like isoform X1 [Mytilus edulis]|uniref:solute carrier family 2, facilitated glucose transporter member 1-like isoform X1 n=1 Tax=Mytilus edulis TaxID=6550 RepID=UPI0039EECD80